jgi:hypothetical protein
MGMDKSAVFYHPGDRLWGVRHDERYVSAASQPTLAKKIRTGHPRSITGNKKLTIKKAAPPARPKVR